MISMIEIRQKIVPGFGYSLKRRKFGFIPLHNRTIVQQYMDVSIETSMNSVTENLNLQKVLILLHSRMNV